MCAGLQAECGSSCGNMGGGLRPPGRMWEPAVKPRNCSSAQKIAVIKSVHTGLPAFKSAGRENVLVFVANL